MPSYFGGGQGRQAGPANDWNNYQAQQYYGQNQAPQQPMQPFQQIFVQGEAGARAYQLPYGCNFGILWDAEAQTFYIKRIDPNGRPLPLEAYDYSQHVDPSSQPVDLSKYVTIDQLKDLFGKLTVGSEGRIVLNESSI